MNKLGRKVNHDLRSLSYGFDTNNIVIKDVSHKRLIPILDQGQVGSCTGNAGIGAINTEPFTQSATPHYTPDENGALKLYADAERVDGGIGYPPEDVGSSGLSIAKALLQAGLISGYQHTFTLNDALKALTVYPVIVGINWYTHMFTPDPDGRVHLTGTVEGGHEVQAYKIDCENGRIWFHNSWGTQWGVQGDFYLTWQDFATLLAQQGDVTVLLPITHTPPPIQMYKYFKDSEVVGLKVELVQKLDKARGIAGVPFVITSGFRTPAENQACGGVPDSAHLTGEAADIACSDSQSRFKIVSAMLQVGFNRIEVCPQHVHCDVSKTHPQDVMVLSQNG